MDGCSWGHLMMPIHTWRRQVNSCRGVRPCRRATSQTLAPSARLSATMAAFRSALHVLRRPAPVKTSIRRVGARSSSDMCLCSEIGMCRSPLSLRLSLPMLKKTGGGKTPVTVKTYTCQERQFRGFGFQPAKPVSQALMPDRRLQMGEELPRANFPHESADEGAGNIDIIG